MPRNITIITEQTIRRVIMPNSNNIIKVTANRMPKFKNAPYAQQQQPYGGAKVNSQQKNMRGSNGGVANATNLADTF